MRQVALTPFMRGGQAQPSLRLPIERARWLVGMAPMRRIHAVDGGSRISLEPEQRADAIHGPQDTNSPAGKTDGADE